MRKKLICSALIVIGVLGVVWRLSWSLLAMSSSRVPPSALGTEIAADQRNCVNRAIPTIDIRRLPPLACRMPIDDSPPPPCAEKIGRDTTSSTNLQLNVCLFNSGEQNIGESRENGRACLARDTSSPAMVRTAALPTLSPVARPAGAPVHSQDGACVAVNMHGWAEDVALVRAARAAEPRTPSLVPQTGHNQMVNGTLTYKYYRGVGPFGPQLPGPPVDAGTYTVVVSFRSADGNFTDGSAATTFTIQPATPAVHVEHPGGTYNGMPIPATQALAEGAARTPVGLSASRPVLCPMVGPCPMPASFGPAEPADASTGPALGLE